MKVSITGDSDPSIVFEKLFKTMMAFRRTKGTLTIATDSQ
jgi:hypothetical protein